MSYGDISRTESWPDVQSRLATLTGRDLLIDAGEVATALLDAGIDAHALVLRAARNESVADELARIDAPQSITTKTGEGFAFYAVYPEQYAAAARTLSPRGTVTVIGIPSIGTTLGAAVAAASNAQHFITVRPEGHPFDRTLGDDVVIPEADEYYVVDEGPGLSGSSFAAVARHLESRGVADDRIVFFPSHANGPGAMAGDARRARYARARKAFLSFEDFFSPHGRDLGGGQWRALHVADAPAFPTRERRKYLDGNRLTKFAGLGRYARERHDYALALARAGLTPPVLAYADGMITTEWLDGEPAAPDLDTVTRYLTFVRDHAPRSDAGARLLPPALQSRAAPILGDNRMHRWEWLATRDRGIVKCDAIDHAHAHDGVGAQDLGWDVVAAEVELGLDARTLRDGLGLAWNDDELACIRRVYAETQRRWFAQIASEMRGDDAARLEAEVARYDSQCARK